MMRQKFFLNTHVYIDQTLKGILTEKIFEQRKQMGGNALKQKSKNGNG